uniref:Uncharacterized protein n=1 Tax=Trichogramma kaykai TaxID=54128 RepID=A0ABD2WWT3_9HYME
MLQTYRVRDLPDRWRDRWVYRFERIREIEFSRYTRRCSSSVYVCLCVCVYRLGEPWARKLFRRLRHGQLRIYTSYLRHGPEQYS